MQVPLLLAATGEVATAEELGGAEMHAQVAGTAEYLAENDADGIRLAREIFEHLNWKEQIKPVDVTYKEPRYDTEELLGVIPSDPKQPFDMKEVVARIIDDSDFLEFKQEYDDLTVCGWAKWWFCILVLLPIMVRLRLKEPRKQLSLYTCVSRLNVHYCSCITPQVLWWEPMPNKMALSSMARN